MAVVIDGVEYVPARNTVAEAGPGTLGTALLRARRSCGWSLEQASTEVGISRGHLWSLEHDKSEPSLRMADSLSRAYGISLELIADYVRRRQS